MRASRVVPLVLAVACGRAGGPAGSPDQGSFRVAGVGASADPTVRSARLIPETVDETQGYGTEPSGGTRAITAGLRVVTTRDGAILVARDRFPQAPQITVALPERVGGGFLFVLGNTVWRADHWLDAAKPIFASLQGIQAIVPGLDRVYVRMQNAYVAVDGKAGAVLDLGPWPASPFISSFAAVDGWRAAAVADLRGVVATFDAGATWRALDLPMDPRQVLVTADSLAVGGIENGRTEAWFEIRADGAIARLSGAPPEAKGRTLQAGGGSTRPTFPGAYPGGYAGLTVPAPPFPTPPATGAAPRLAGVDAHEGGDESVHHAETRVFGKRPLAAAIEDGWPLSDGTAIVARDGALGRVRLSDGVLTEVVQSAFPLKPARCHPVSLTRPSAVGAFGFVCGEPRGKAAIYAYDSVHGQLTELKRFDRPRVVTSSGNGAIAVRGPCAEDGDPSTPPYEAERVEPTSDGGRGDRDGDAGGAMNDARHKPDPEPAKAEARAPEVHPYCILGHDNTWREIHVRGEVAGERVIVLADGKIVVVSPPQGQTAPARITLLEKGRATTLPVVFPKVTPDVARVLRLGVWLDGFEERKPGVVGGWVEAGGAMLGIEIALDGKATPGQFVRDAGMPFVSGRYGFGWTPSRRGFETTDGGATWTSLELPEPLVAAAKVERRACGPIGCIAAGWMRVGWGEMPKPPAPVVPAPFRASTAASPPQLALTCESTTPTMPPPAAPNARPVVVAPPKVTFGGHRSFSGSPVLGGIGSGVTGGVSEMPPFFAQPGPTLHESERGVPFEVQELPERYPRLGPLARIYAWGPKTGDWDTQGKWQVKWLSPFAGWPEARASLPTLAPQSILDSTRASSPFGYGGYSGGSGLFQIANGDDPSHALLLARRPARTDVTPIELEVDRAPVEIRRADGEPFLEIDAATRTAGRWFLATTPPAGGAPVTTVWQVDGAVARELVRVPRAALEAGRPAGTKLARRSDGRAIGLVVEGQATAERSAGRPWVLPIDLETGQLGEPEPLGTSDLAARTLEACTDDVVGWVFDASLPGTTVRVHVPGGAGSMHSVYARIRLTASRGCVERVAGMYDGQSPERAAQLTRPGVARAPSTSRPGELTAAAFAAQGRYALRCTVTK